MSSARSSLVITESVGLLNLPDITVASSYPSWMFTTLLRELCSRSPRWELIKEPSTGERKESKFPFTNPIGAVRITFTICNEHCSQVGVMCDSEMGRLYS